MVAGDDEVAVASKGERAVVVVGEHVGHDEADLWGQGRPAFARVKPVQRRAILGNDLEDALRVAIRSLGRQGAGAGRHVDQRHLVAAQRQARLIGRDRLVQRLHAHPPGDVDHPVDAGTHLDLNRRDVVRIAERVGKRLPAVVGAVVVVRGVAAAVRQLDVERRVEHPGAHGELPRLDRRRVGEHLEGGAGLAGDDRHVVFTAGHVGAGGSNHGQHRAGLRIDGDQRPVRDVLSLERHHLGTHLTFGDRLQVPVEGGHHREPAVFQQVRAVRLLQLRGDPMDETRRLDIIRSRRLLQGERLGGDGLGLRRADVVGFDHRREHHPLSQLGTVGVGKRIELGRRLRQTGQEARLCQGQLAGGLAEVGLRRGFHPIGAVSVKDAVQVGLEDLRLRVLMLDLDGEDGLVELAQNRSITGQIDVLDQLLGDRAPALVEAQVEQVLQPGLSGAQQVEPAVLVEGPVFDRDRRLPHRRRHLVESHDVAPLGSLVDLGQQDGPGPVVDAGRERQPSRAQVRRRR